MKKIIEGMNVLEQTPIKEYTTLSKNIQLLGLAIAIIAIIAIIILIIKTKPDYNIDVKSKFFKGFLFFYVLGLVMLIFAVIRFPWFYEETGKYIYKCVMEDNVPVNYIGNNFDVISVEGNIWELKER